MWVSNPEIAARKQTSILTSFSIDLRILKKGFALKSDLHAHLDQIASLTFLAIIRIKKKNLQSVV